CPSSRSSFPYLGSAIEEAAPRCLTCAWPGGPGVSAGPLFHGTCGEPFHEVALQEHENEHRRQRSEDGGGHGPCPVLLHLTEHGEQQARPDRAQIIACDERQRREQIVPSP